MRMRPWTKQFGARLRRCLFVGICLLGYLVTVLGVPIPVHRGKDSRTPFPCQDHACGCMNAEQCWKSCCCFTATERLAWAHEHAVQPPASLFAEAEQGWNTPRLRDQETAKAEDKPSCCKSSRTESICPECAQHHPASTGICCSTNKEEQLPETQQPIWVSTLLAQRCQGVSQHGISIIPSLPPPSRLVIGYELVFLAWVRPTTTVASSFCSPPVDPPPRLAWHSHPSSI
jgi:hypothetical protein